MQQEVIWIRDSLDYYQMRFAEIERAGKNINDFRKIRRINGDLTDLARRIRENIFEYEEKLNAEQSEELVGKMKRYTFQKKINLFYAYQREVEDLQERFKSIARI